MSVRPTPSSSRADAGGDLFALGAALGFVVGLLWLGQPLLWITVGVVAGLLLGSLRT